MMSSVGAHPFGISYRYPASAARFRSESTYDHTLTRREMVRLASIVLNRPGDIAIASDADGDDEVIILAAELPSNQGYVRLSSIARDAREFLALGSGGLDKARTLLASPEARPSGDRKSVV